MEVLKSACIHDSLAHGILKAAKDLLKGQPIFWFLLETMVNLLVETLCTIITNLVNSQNNSEISQRVKVLIAKLDGLSSKPRTYTREGEN